MRILVTGAAGFIGSWICDALTELGHFVVGVDNLIGGDWGNVTVRHKDKFRHYQLSVENLTAMESVTKGCEAVYHCAALAYEGLSVFSPSVVVRNVVCGTVNVAGAAIKAGVKRFVNCSSMARYGPIFTPYREEHAPLPADPYGIAKLCAEQQLNVLGKVHGMMVVHAVPHNVYGPRQKYDDPYRNVAAIFANLMLQGKQPCIYGDGKQRRCFSHIDDVLPVMLKLLTCEAEHGEVFNVGPDGGEITVLELAEMIAEIVGIPFDPVFLLGRPCEVRQAWCSSDKIRKRFGWSQQISLKRGIETLVEWIKLKGPKPFNHHLPLEIDGPLVPKTWKEKLYR